ncbi:unnamed protein product [Heligmosomoides polygyrus]|uniref:Endo/exonuclease/phosphatase domain-containing protein n=1 Tax=Heligmosomoides polygyrus TaxID=6339 RepID=A0A183GI54_HELPZ|nr:unnamed protein product [Heligmosomoides polygyrus]
MATLNVGTLSGRSFELAEALKRRKIDLCAVQETSPKTTSGVGIMVYERLRDAIASVERFNDRLMKVLAKDEFWSLLDEKRAEVPLQDVIIVAGDLNGHVGARRYAESHDLTIVNTRFRKRESQLNSFYSGNSKAQIVFVLVRNRDQGLVTDAKVVPYEAGATKHSPLICTMKITLPMLRQVEPR